MFSFVCEKYEVISCKWTEPMVLLGGSCIVAIISGNNYKIKKHFLQTIICLILNTSA